ICVGTRGPWPVTLDPGALIAIERGDEKVRALRGLAKRRVAPAYVQTPVAAEAWEGGAGRKARLATILRTGRDRGQIRIPPLDFDIAIQIGMLLARARTARVTVTDAMVAWCVLRYGGIACTSDPDDLGKLLPPERIRVV